MKATGRAPRSIDEYIAGSPPEARAILRRIRATAARAAPAARETISYRMAAFMQGGVLLYFAAFRNHIGVFPPVSGDVSLVKALAPYAGPKGNLRFPYDRPIRYDLIRRIVKLRVAQNAARGAEKGARRSLKRKKA
jgi:uncharacterized protein YdhG (YjbR/CyaY superfamily)